MNPLLTKLNIPIHGASSANEVTYPASANFFQTIGQSSKNLFFSQVPSTVVKFNPINAATMLGKVLSAKHVKSIKFYYLTKSH